MYDVVAFSLLSLSSNKRGKWSGSPCQNQQHEGTVRGGESGQVSCMSEDGGTVPVSRSRMLLVYKQLGQSYLRGFLCSWLLLVRSIRHPSCIYQGVRWNIGMMWAFIEQTKRGRTYRSVRSVSRGSICAFVRSSACVPTRMEFVAGFGRFDFGLPICTHSSSSNKLKSEALKTITKHSNKQRTRRRVQRYGKLVMTYKWLHEWQQQGTSYQSYFGVE